MGERWCIRVAIVGGFPGPLLMREAGEDILGHALLELRGAGNGWPRAAVRASRKALVSTKTRTRARLTGAAAARIEAVLQGRVDQTRTPWQVQLRQRRGCQRDNPTASNHFQSRSSEADGLDRILRVEEN